MLSKNGFSKPTGPSSRITVTFRLWDVDMPEGMGGDEEGVEKDERKEKGSIVIVTISATITAILISIQQQRQ